MTRLIRQGECNLCGQCCGSGGIHPWPANWPQAMRNWANIEDIENSWPMMRFANFVQQNDRWLIQNEGQEINIGGVGKITFELHPVNGFTRPGTTECPFLDKDPGDGTRPCMLVGSRGEGIYDVMCKEGGPSMLGAPRLVYEDIDQGESGICTAQQQVDLWMSDFPDCSFTYVEEVE